MLLTIIIMNKYNKIVLIIMRSKNVAVLLFPTTMATQAAKSVYLP